MKPASYLFINYSVIWIQLLYKARKRYGLSILNFIVTSNHIHLIAIDNGNPKAIPSTMQYVAGRTGQEYNQRKNRKGAFWQGRYHATAIESGDHLWRCLVYVDLNMVRAGAVDHPSQWKWCGFNEIQTPKKRYRLIDHDQLRTLLNVKSHEVFVKVHQQWVESKLAEKQTRQESFSRSIAVGSEDFVADIRKSLGARACGRNISPINNGSFQLREPEPLYANAASLKKQRIIAAVDNENQLLWNIS